MFHKLWQQLALIFIGASVGGVIAAGVFAFLAIIGVFPRLIGKTGTKEHIYLYDMMIILGGVLIAHPFNSLRALCVLVGAVVALCGAALLVRAFRPDEFALLRFLWLPGGIVCLGAGLFLLFFPDGIIGAVPMVFGLFVIFDSLVRLHDAWRLRKAGGSVGGMLLPLAVSLVLGAVMLFDPFDAAESMMIAIGAILIVEGVMNLCTGVYAAARLRACLKEHPEVLDGETQRPTIEGDAPAVDVEFRDVSSTDPQDKPENKPE